MRKNGHDKDFRSFAKAPKTDGDLTLKLHAAEVCHGICSYIYMYINEVANNVILHANYIYDSIFIRQFLKEKN